MHPARIMAALILVASVLVIQEPEHAVASTAGLFRHELELPVKGRSRRVTRREFVRPNETLVLFDEEGPGCVFHWWLTYSRSKKDIRDRAHDMRIRVYYDGSQAPDFDVSLAQFFSILLDKKIFPVDNAAIKV